MERPRTVVRPARDEDLALLPEIERRAAQRFAGIPAFAHLMDDATEVDDLRRAHADGLVWVATVDDALVGWCYASEKDDSLFVEEIDVLPEYGRRGIGRALLDAVESEAARLGRQAVTLTTDAIVAWNGPWYESLGFVVVPPEAQGVDLARAVAAEANHGLDLRRRVAMRRPVL
jgi:GNAT superfamily N-acetyltransferase